MVPAIQDAYGNALTLKDRNFAIVFVKYNDRTINHFVSVTRE